MPVKLRPDEVAFREEVLRELASLRDYFGRERDVLLREITQLRQQLEASQARIDDPVTPPGSTGRPLAMIGATAA